MRPPGEATSNFLQKMQERNAQRLKQEAARQASLQQQQSEIASFVGETIPGMDEAQAQNPLLSAMAGRVARVSAAETGELETFNQFFRERVTSRDVLADFFTGLGSSILGQRTLSLRDKKLQEFQLEKQDRARQQQARQQAENEFLRVAQAQQQGISISLKASRDRSEDLETSIESLQRDSAKLRDSLRDDKNAEYLDHMSQMEKRNVALVNGFKKGTEANLTGMKLLRERGGQLTDEDVETLEELNRFDQKSKEAQALRVQAAKESGSAQTVYGILKEVGSLSQVPAGLKENVPEALALMRQRGEISAPPDVRQEVQTVLASMQTTDELFGLYQEAYGLGPGDPGLSGVAQRMEEYVLRTKAVIGESAASELLEGMGIEAARAKLIVQGEQRFSDADIETTMLSIPNVELLPETVRRITSRQNRNTTKKAYDDMATQYLATPGKTKGPKVSWQNVKRLLQTGKFPVGGQLVEIPGATEEQRMRFIVANGFNIDWSIK